LDNRKNGCTKYTRGDYGIDNSSYRGTPAPFEVLAIFLGTVLLGGVIVAMKGVYSAGDLPLFGGSAVAFVAAFMLTLVTLDHFLPAPQPSFFLSANSPAFLCGSPLDQFVERP
jgi:hypothetical protein